MSHAPVMPVDAPAHLEWPEALRPAVDEAISHYPVKRSAVLPLLWIAQRHWGWLPPAALRLVARTLELDEPEVFGVATFYTMFNLRPVGRHHEHKLGVANGGTTPDGRFTLRKVECLAACGYAPCMQVNLDYHENLDEAKVDALLEKLK